jgi:uncharacterized membrane protein
MISSVKSGALAAALICAVALPAAAQTSGTMTNATHAGSPVNVSRCDAEHNPGSPGGYSYAGYSPGFYPYAGRPYGWRDPYGGMYYQPPISPSGTLFIDYHNATPNTMKSIVFGLVANGRLVAEVKDVGTFSSGAEIRHKFGLSPNVFPLQTGLPICAPLYIEYENGTTWKNPRLPAAPPHSAYGSPQH